MIEDAQRAELPALSRLIGLIPVLKIRIRRLAAVCFCERSSLFGPLFEGLFTTPSSVKYGFYMCYGIPENAEAGRNPSFFGNFETGFVCEISKKRV